MHYVTLYQYGLSTHKLLIIDESQAPASLAFVLDRHKKFSGHYVHCLQLLPSARSYALQSSNVILSSLYAIAHHRCIDVSVVGPSPGAMSTFTTRQVGCLDRSCGWKLVYAGSACRPK
jgi:hypothetical protein